MIGVDSKIKTKLNELEVQLSALEERFVTKQRCFGAGAVEASLTPYQFTSAAADFGTEVQILQTADTPFETGKNFFDLRGALITNVSLFELIIFRLIWGTGTVAAAEAAGNYSDHELIRLSTLTIAGGLPAELTMPKLPTGTMNVWGKIKATTNLLTMSCVFGLHEYDN